GEAYNPRYPESQAAVGVPMDLDDWRSRINDLDNRILQLLNQRAEAALQIGDLKRRQDAPSYAPEREAEIFRRLTEAAAGPLSAEAILTVWREILSACRALESALTVSYFGPQATFTHRAALLPDVTTEQALSTAAAAEMAAVDATVAAIASDLAAELYGVPILRAGIEDNPHNSTRFLVVGRHPSGATGRDKTSILFAMRNEPGTLYRILEPLSRLGINLTKIESRPAKHRPLVYVICVDVEGHRDTPPVSSALREIGERTLFLKVLGSYPAV